MTEPPRRLNDLIEHRLQPFRTRDRAENLADSPSLLAQVLVIPNELLNVGLHALIHEADFTTNRLTRRRAARMWAPRAWKLERLGDVVSDLDGQRLAEVRFVAETNQVQLE